MMSWVAELTQFVRSQAADWLGAAISLPLAHRSDEDQSQGHGRVCLRRILGSPRRGFSSRLVPIFSSNLKVCGSVAGKVRDFVCIGAGLVRGGGFEVLIVW